MQLMSKREVSNYITKVKEIMFETMRIKIERVIMFVIETTRQQLFNGVIMVTEKIRVGPMFHLKNQEVSPRYGETSMARVQDMFEKLMRRFDASDVPTKELKGHMANIVKKVDAHPISINHFELQMIQFFSTVNPCKSGILFSNTGQNLKNIGHCMSVTTRGGNKTIDPPIQSGV